ncbi:WD40/YVTN/BNR-like repeat-containing protein [Methylobrevis pamukkalensis]|uniref:BNR/Asp-box repeat protein n=1 Tax=Methylobrevis pamukkalensis TaxID=1439726 RepID=A0A1E3H7C6_9HYPH|nr:sialidase family protein [Methylobrevis pamukkalensis]ODN71676.1 hypothetical protein A6302_01013 [Methylobrevis pamukkalensis]
MATKVLVLLGTNKGAFILESDAARRDWTTRGPFCDTWPIHHVVADPATGAIHAGGGNGWTGAAVWTSRDLGATWTHSGDGIAYGEGEPAIKSVWSLAAAHGRLYAGVEPAGLFVSDDGGETFTHVAGLRDHPSRPEWQGGGGGLILHSLVPDPDDPDSLHVGISVAGVFHTADGGRSFTARNRGTRCDFNPEDQRYPEHGQCVHSVVRAPGSGGRLYQQNHCGMYRSDDGGAGWDSIEAGLPSSFGFPVAVHPRDPQTVYLVPLNGDVDGRFMPDAKAAVWRSRDAGATWTDLRCGLPQDHAYLCVLRQALATDRLDPAGVYFGSNSGALFASADEGDNWRLIAQHLPMIMSVETLVIDD